MTRVLRPQEITEFFKNGFPDAETIEDNNAIGWLIYYLGDSNIDINQYVIVYESVFYDSYKGALHGDYFE